MSGIRCHAKLARAYGVAPDASGVARMRVVGFRAHCAACGLLSDVKTYDNARYVTRVHNKKKHDPAAHTPASTAGSQPNGG